MKDETTLTNDQQVAQRIELRSENGPLLGVLVLPRLRLEVKRGKRLFDIDLFSTLHSGNPVILERKLTHQSTGKTPESEAD